MKKTTLLVGALLLAIVSISPALADEVSIGASKDNTLYEDAVGDVSNGAGAHFFTGSTAFGGTRRGVIAFDVAGAVPAGATIDSVTLTLHMSMTIAFPQSTSLHRIEDDWGEGASDADGEEGAGTDAERGDATWVHRFFPGTDWASDGGDFDPVASAVELVGNNGFYSWNSEAMAADVQAWLDFPTENFGWIVLGNEDTDTTAKRFDSRENGDESERPVLTIEYTPGAPPVPASSGAGQMLLLAVLLAAGTLLASRFRSAKSH